MNAKSIELFKALTEATFWFYTHPKDISYRLIYNKSRYTMDKVRILKMLRLYLPFVRRLDDQALVTYMYRNGGVVMAQVQSGQLMSLQSVSEELPNTLQALADSDLAAQQKALDVVIAKEEERQRKETEEKQKKTAQGNRATSSVSQPKPTTSSPLAEKFNDEYAAMAENLGMRSGTGNVEVSPVRLSAAARTVVNRTRIVGSQSKTLTQPKNMTGAPLASTSTGPSRWEKVLGGVMTASTGAPIVSAGRNLTSQTGVFIKRQGVDRVGKVFSDWLNRGGGQGGGRSGDSYEIEEEIDGETIYLGSGTDEPKKKGWALLGLGLGWWLAILFILVLIFSTLSGAEEEKQGGSGDTGTPQETTGGGRGGICPTLEAIKANRQNPESCRYFGLGVDLFNTNISNMAIETYVSKYSPIFIKAGKGDAVEFRKRVDYIVQSSKIAGLNPVLFLGYWKTESLFSTIGSRDLGCLGDDFYEQVDCALGIRAFADPTKNPIANCARSKEAESVACKTLKGIRSKPFLDPQNPISYPIKTFDDFAEAHGSRAPELGGDAVNNNCVSTYNSLVEEAITAGECKEDFVGENSCQGGWPVTGRVTQGPEGVLHIKERRGTNRVAVDIGAEPGTPVYATFGGTIVGVSYVDTGWEDGRGLFVEIKTNQKGTNGEVVTARYLHFSQLAEGLQNGQLVEVGALLGYVGASGLADGPHLHMDLTNAVMAPPYIPVAIRPSDCEEIKGVNNCQPKNVTACK